MRRVISLSSVVALLVAGLALAQVAEGSFPGTNGKIAFISDRDGDNEVFTMNADGTDQVNLTDNTSIEFEPAWSADGSKIAFVSNRDGNNEIYTMNADGSNPIRVTNNTTSERNPAWTPDGTRIVFNSFRQGDAEIFIINAAGGPETQLTNNETTDVHPVVSPDGSRVAFVSAVTGFTIYTMNLDGTGALPLTAGLRPDWSPDGETITFHSGGASDDVSIISASGTGQINLTGSSPSNDDSPAFSPDGTLIAFVSEQFGNRDIFTMTTSGENQTNLTNNPASDISPDWQPTAPIGTSTTSTSSTTSTTVVPVNSCLASLQDARASFNAQIDRHGEALTRTFGSRAADAVASLERTRDEGNARFSAAIARCPRDGT